MKILIDMGSSPGFFSLLVLVIIFALLQIWWIIQTIINGKNEEKISNSFRFSDELNKDNLSKQKKWLEDILKR
tara:strand:+ start:112 stop:330 length:219 start_codon:yes stop_codon:yes gene_type:complete